MTEEFNALKFAMEITHGYSTIEQLVKKLEPSGWRRQPPRKGILLLKNTDETGEPVYCGIITKESEKAIHYDVFLKHGSMVEIRAHLNSMAALRWVERYAINIH